MSRIRTIKPELLDDDRAAELPDRAWRLMVSALVLADDYGRIRASLRYLASNIFSGGRDGVEEAKARLCHDRFWIAYTVNGEEYALIRTFRMHQRIDNAGRPRIPGPEDADQPVDLSDVPSDDEIEAMRAEQRGRGDEAPKAAKPGKNPRAPSVRRSSPRNAALPPIIVPSTSDPERERADAPSLPHEPDSDGPDRADLAPETPSVRSDAPAVSTPAEGSADAPGAKPEALRAIPTAPLRPDLSEDVFGVDEVIAIYNAHRPPALPAHQRDPTNTRFVLDLVEVIRADKRVAASERAAGRELPRPGLHTAAGWMAFTQRLHAAKSLPGWNPPPSLTKWVAGAAGDRMRAELWRGAYDVARDRGGGASPAAQSADRSAEAQKKRRDEADRRREEEHAKIKPSRGVPAEVRAKMAAAGFGLPVPRPEPIPGDEPAGE